MFVTVVAIGLLAAALVGRAIGGDTTVVAADGAVLDGPDDRAAAPGTSTTEVVTTTSAVTSTTAPPPSTTVPPPPTTAAPTTTVPLPTTTAPTAPPRRPRSVGVVGDSLVAQSIDDVLAALVAQGWGANIFGHPGQAMDAPSILGAALADAADPGIDVVVLATTANDNVVNARRSDDAGSVIALSEYRARLEERLALLGDRCVVVVDTRDNATELYHSSFAPATNTELRAFAASHPNVVVVPWSEISRAHGDDWFLEDGLHFTDGTADHPATVDRPAGRAAYAAAIVDGAHRCP